MGQIVSSRCFCDSLSSMRASSSRRLEKPLFGRELVLFDVTMESDDSRSKSGSVERVKWSLKASTLVQLIGPRYRMGNKGWAPSLCIEAL